VAVELAKKIFQDLSDKTVLLIGAGDMAELAARCLIEAGTSKLIVANRSTDRAEDLAARHGGSAVAFDSLYEVLPSADIVLCSTGAPEYVIRRSETRQALKGRKKGPVFFVDISVPRNIDPEIAGLDNVFLFDIDDLDSVVKSNIREREQEAGRAEIIIDDEVQALVQQLRALDIGPAVVEVKELLLHIVLNEFKRNRKRLGDLSPAQETAIEDVLIPALVNKLSHPMIVHLRNAAGTGKPSQMVEELRKMIRID